MRRSRGRRAPFFAPGAGFWRGVLGGWRRRLLLLLALLVVSPLLLVAAGSVLPVYVTSFMLQSPVHPVQHTWVPRERIADSARRAVVAAEDQKFWAHNGFDFEAMRKAYRGNQRGGRVRGGSTISQQTAKNLFLWPGGGYFRKGLEAGFTVLIETFWSKDRILEVYLNSAEFGPGLYGVEAAAQRYFRKPASRLTASEAARLAAVLPSPRRWRVDNPGAYVRQRAAWIQRQMGYAGASAPVRESEPEPALPAGERFDDESADRADPVTPVPPAPVPARHGEDHTPSARPDADAEAPATPAPVPADPDAPLPDPVPIPAADTAGG